MAPQERRLRLPLLLLRQICEVLHFFRRISCDRQPVPVQQPIAGERDQPCARCNDADQIQRIGGGQRQVLLSVRLAAHVAQKTDRLRRCILLAREAGDEPTAPDLPPPLQAPPPHQHAPPPPPPPPPPPHPL